MPNEIEPREEAEQLQKIDRDQVFEMINENDKAIELGQKVKFLMGSPVWVEVIEEMYINNYAKDLIHTMGGHSDSQKQGLIKGLDIRASFINTMYTWIESGDRAAQQNKELQADLAMNNEDGALQR